MEELRRLEERLREPFAEEVARWKLAAARWRLIRDIAIAEAIDDHVSEAMDPEEIARLEERVRKEKLGRARIDVVRGMLPTYRYIVERGQQDEIRALIPKRDEEEDVDQGDEYFAAIELLVSREIRRRTEERVEHYVRCAVRENRCRKIESYVRAHLRGPRRAEIERLDAAVVAPFPWPEGGELISIRNARNELLGVTHSISRDHLEELEASTISQVEAVDAGLWTETWEPLLAAMLRTPVPAGAEFLVYPYYRPEGVDPQYFHAKRTDLTPSQLGKTKGYRKPRGVRVGVYYPWQVIRSGDLANVDRPLIVVEGEKKAMCLARLGYAAIGLAGVHCGHETPRPNGKWILHPWIREDVEVEGRRIVIAFDSNLRHNTSVRQAARRTARLFYDAGAAEVRIVCWPDTMPPGVNGVDDLAARCGDSRVHDLLDNASRIRPLGSITVPSSIRADKSLSATQKMIYGVLYAHADGQRIRDISHAEMSGVLRGRSPQTIGKVLRTLISKGYIRRGRRVRELRHARWISEPNTYILLNDHRGEEETIILSDDLALGDAEALVVGVLRPISGYVLTRDLAAACGMPPSTLRRTLASLGTRVDRQHGRVRLAPAETQPSPGREEADAELPPGWMKRSKRSDVEE